MFQTLVLNDFTLCKVFCTSYERTDKIQSDQRMARMTYSLGFILLGLFCFLVKNQAESIFWFLASDLSCYQSHPTLSCFKLVMIYWLATVSAFYHLVLIILAMIRNRVVYSLVDWNWTLKVLFFGNLFFLSCKMPNWVFQSLSIVYLYLSLLFQILIVIFLYDCVFFYLNKGRFLRKKGWSKCWNIFAVFLGIFSLLSGIGIQVFGLYYYYPLCGTYQGISVLFLVLGLLVVLVHCVKYKMKNESYSSMVYFLVICLQTMSIISATPNSNCIPSQDTVFIQTALISNADSILSEIIRFYLCRFDSDFY